MCARCSQDQECNRSSRGRSSRSRIPFGLSSTNPRMAPSNNTRYDVSSSVSCRCLIVLVKAPLPGSDTGAMSLGDRHIL